MRLTFRGGVFPAGHGVADLKFLITPSAMSLHDRRQLRPGRHAQTGNDLVTLDARILDDADDRSDAPC